MEIYTRLDEMKPFVAARDWHGLEQRYSDACRVAAGDEAARRIASVLLVDFEAALGSVLSRALSTARENQARAVYFEYDLDNDWQSGFFVCPEYLSEDAGDDDWACDFSAHFDGPDLTEFSAIYRERGFDRTPQAIGCTTFLVARTLAAFGRASEHLLKKGIAICAAFHDQTPIVRFHE